MEAKSDREKGGRSLSVENAGSLPDSQLVLDLLRRGAMGEVHVVVRHTRPDWGV